MRLQVALGHAVWYTDSFGDLEPMKRAFARAAELAERAGGNRDSAEGVVGDMGRRPRQRRPPIRAHGGDAI